MQCASCGKPRASKEAREDLPEACYDHEQCPSCVGWCWYANDHSCAEAHGGWAYHVARQRTEWTKAYEALGRRLATADHRLYVAARERDAVLAENAELRRRLRGEP